MAEDLKALSRELRKLRREIVVATNRATAQTARETERYARRLSSGPFSLAALATHDHPYAVRHGGSKTGLGKGLFDPSVINQQSGLFRSSWTIYYLPTSSGLIVPVVRNAAPYARYLEEGTTTMVARPMVVRLEFFAERAWDRIAPPFFEAVLSRTAFAR